MTRIKLWRATAKPTTKISVERLRIPVGLLYLVQACSFKALGTWFSEFALPLMARSQRRECAPRFKAGREQRQRHEAEDVIDPAHLAERQRFKKAGDVSRFKPSPRNAGSSRLDFSTKSIMQNRKIRRVEIMSPLRDRCTQASLLWTSSSGRPPLVRRNPPPRMALNRDQAFVRRLCATLS